MRRGWALAASGPSDQEAACPAYAACAQLAASRDSTRFLSWASNKKDKDRFKLGLGSDTVVFGPGRKVGRSERSGILEDKCLDHATAISFNSYPAWYSKPGDLHAPGVEWNKSAAWARAQQPQKPFFVSETGAGGIFEWKNKTDVFWSLKYQQEAGEGTVAFGLSLQLLGCGDLQVIDADVDTALADDNVSGIVLWHFFDFKGAWAHFAEQQGWGILQEVPDCYTGVFSFRSTMPRGEGGRGHRLGSGC